MTTLSLTLREAFFDEQTAEFPVVLVELTPAEGDDTFYLCSEAVRRISPDPVSGKIRFGVISNGIEYAWIVMSVTIPDDQEGKPPSSRLSLMNVVENMAEVARSVTPGTQISVVLKSVLSSDPDAIEEMYELIGTGSTYDATYVSIELSREPIEAEPYPSDRMTKQNAPGLF